MMLSPVLFLLLVVKGRTKICIGRLIPRSLVVCRTLVSEKVAYSLNLITHIQKIQYIRRPNHGSITSLHSLHSKMLRPCKFGLDTL